MKNWVIIIILLLMPILLLAEIPPKTEIIIFGIVHQATENFDGEDMLKILDQVRPDVILFEHPISWPAEEFSKIIQKIENPTLETIMVKKYLDENPSVLLRYFDKENRDKYYIETRYFERQKAFNKKLEDLITKSKSNDSISLPNEQISMLLNYDKLNKSLSKEYSRVINSTVADSIYAIKHNYFNASFLKFTENVPELKQFKEYIISRQKYWEKRNQAMVKNIIKYAEEFQGKKIIVVTGCEHRYYLRNELKESKKQTFVLKEYWEHE